MTDGLRSLAALVIALGLMSGVPACGESPPCGLVVCDIREAACQSRLAESAACMRGVEPAAIPIHVVSRDEFIAGRTAETLTPEEESNFRDWNDSLALLGMAPENLSPAESAETSAGWVGGFYSSRDKAITIVDWGYPLSSIGAVGLLVHEYVHALQDAHFDLAALGSQFGVDRDRQLALAAVIEGDASYVEDRVALGLFGTEDSDVPWDEMFAHWQDNSRSKARASNLPVTLAPLHFNYPFGEELAYRATVSGGRSAVDALFASPPTGTREVMAGFGAQEPAGGAWAEDLGDDAVPVLPPERYTPRAVDRMGAWNVGLLFERAQLNFAKRAADGLRGDMLSIHRDVSTGGPVAVWRFRFATDELAAEVATTSHFAEHERIDRIDRDVILVVAQDEGGLYGIPRPLTFRAVLGTPTGPAPTSAAWRGETRCARRPTFN